jgi:hypothetical protein
VRKDYIFSFYDLLWRRELLVFITCLTEEKKGTGEKRAGEGQREREI